MYVCLCLCLCKFDIDINVHTYIHTYIHTYVHTYKHTYIRTYVHTYIHTYIFEYQEHVRDLSHQIERPLVPSKPCPLKSSADFVEEAVFVRGASVTKVLVSSLVMRALVVQDWKATSENPANRQKSEPESSHKRSIRHVQETVQSPDLLNGRNITF